MTTTPRDAFEQEIKAHHYARIKAPIFPPLLADILAAADRYAKERVREALRRISSSVICDYPAYNDIVEGRNQAKEEVLYTVEAELAALNLKETKENE